MYRVGSAHSYQSRVFSILLATALYIPLLMNYIDGCVQSDKGSFISRNLNILVSNYISMEAENAITIVGLTFPKLIVVGSGAIRTKTK